jgi:hypothetical protein
VENGAIVRRLPLPAAAVSLETILVAVERLIYSAYGGPDRRGRWVRKAVVRAALDGGGSWELAVPFREALADPRDAWFAVKAPSPGTGAPVEELEVELVGLSAESSKQASMLEGRKLAAGGGQRGYAPNKGKRLSGKWWRWSRGRASPAAGSLHRVRP